MRFSPPAVLGALCALLAACGGESGSEADVWHFRGVNAIADASVVQFYIADTPVETADYAAVSAYHPAHTGTQAIRLGIRNPSDLSRNDPGVTAIGTSEEFDFEGTTAYTLIAAGTVANPQKFLITGTSRDSVGDNLVEYQFVNAAIDAGPLEVLITAPGAGITTPQSVGTLNVGEASGATELTVAAASGADAAAPRTVGISIEIRDGNGAAIFQSSALNVAEQNRKLFVITDHSAFPNVSSLKVLAVDGVAAGTATTLYNSGDVSEFRFAHLSRDTGPLDLYVEGNNVASNIAFGAQSAYVVLPPGTYSSNATPAGNPGMNVFTGAFVTAASQSFTLYAEGPLSTVRGVIISDDRRVVATESRLRFLHASAIEGGGAVDIYVRQDGAGLDLSGRTPPTPTISSLGYRAASGTFALKPGTYEGYVARSGVKSTVLGPVPLVVAAGDVKTFALTDSATSELTLLTVDDVRP